ncbi:MAG: alpha/beta fold hydrolase [Candidatus Thermoplasmatota archaeon]|nr:alpha/beta fold hydrolase [Candidatus Thermoplasmatota archaeon]
MELQGIRQEIVYAKTSDGWYLRIFHYIPEGLAVVRYPVILCHGLAANKNSCDFGEPGTLEWQKYSLAAFLSQQHTDARPVFDVWVPELRGGGPSLFNPRENPKRYRWCVDEYIDKDVPAIIARVQQWYKEKKMEIPAVFWVGKSMGGMIAYAHGETPDGKKDLKGVVTLGSPVVFGKSSVFLEFITRITPRNIALPIRIMELVEKSSELAHHFKGLGANLENVEPAVLERYLQVGLSGVLSSKVLSQFSLFFKHMTFCRYPRFPWLYDVFGRIPRLKRVFAPYSYTENLYRFSAPLLIIAGGLDKMAPKTDMLYVKDHVGSSDVTYLEFSKDAGYQADYGHLDLTLGRHVREEVYPKIYEWLLKQSNKSD